MDAVQADDMQGGHAGERPPLAVEGDACPGGRTRNAEATAAALLAAARVRFTRDGYDATGMREIAADVGVNVALLYRYFGSKEKLFVEAVTGTRQPGETVNGDLDGLTGRILASICRQDREAMGGDHPLVWMLRSVNHPGVTDLMRERMRTGFVDVLADRLQGPDARLRAALVASMMMGVGLLTSVLEVEALAAADREALHAWMDAALRPLVRGQAGDADRTGGG